MTQLNLRFTFLIYICCINVQPNKEEYKELFSAYRNHIRTYVPISDTAWNLIEGIIQPGVLKKGEFSLLEGKTCTYIDFIYKGALRAFSNKDGFEVTTAIYLEDICITNMKSLSTQTPSTVSIQAVEEVAYGRVYKKDLIALYDHSSELQAVGHAILEGMVIAENDWKEMYSLYDPEERYLFLMKKSPDMINRISVQHIASFLGIRRETLSRIRNRTSKSK